MGFKFKMIVPLPKEIYDEVRKNNCKVLETYLDDDGSVVISSLDEEDFNSYICDNDCDGCPLFDEETDMCMKTNKFDINDCLKSDCSACAYRCCTCGACTFDE